MKILLLVVAVWASASSAPIDDAIKLSRYNEECAKQLGYTPEDIERLQKSPEPEAFKKLTLCVMRKDGLISKQGEINRERLRKKILRSGIPEDQTDELLKYCAEQKETPEETAFELDVCVREFRLIKSIYDKKMLEIIKYQQEKKEKQQQ